MLPRVHKAILRHGLIPPGSHVLAGVSGGADSVALLYLLHHLRPRLSFALSAVHVHHGLRGAEADADAEFVQRLAWRLGVPCVVERAEVAARARRDGISVEMAGRAARHAVFHRVARALGADRVATAHHADDQVETLLLRLLRGTGLQGLGGMAPCAVVQGLTLIRPLLEVTHEDLVAFLEAHGLRWREDASNRDTAILRNRVRLELLPFLAAHFQGAVRANLLRTASAVRDDQAWLDQMAGPWMKKARLRTDALRLDRLRAIPVAARRRVLVAWMLEQGIPGERLDFDLWTRLEDWLAGDKARMSLPGGRMLVRSGSALTLVQSDQGRVAPRTLLVQVPGQAQDAAWGLTVRTRMAHGVVRDRARKPGPGRFVATLAAGKLAGADLVVRTRKPGDRMRPYGLAGSVKLQDVLVDLKVPRAGRDCIPVVTCGDEIVWVPGYRVAAAWAVPGPRAPCIRVDLSLRG